MKTNLNNLSNATLINIIENLNTHITHQDYLLEAVNNEVRNLQYQVMDAEQLSADLEEQLSIAYVEIAKLNIIILKEELEEQRQAYYAKLDNDEIPNETWIDNTDAVFTEEIDWDTQTEFPSVSDLLVRCTSCGNTVLASQSHRINHVIVECDTCFATDIPF